MDTKVQDLLKQLGATPELAKSIEEAMLKWKGETETQLQEEFKNRLEKAKQVCIEEVEKEKTDVRRKVEIFLESRVNTIDREAKKQAAIGESEAVRLLREVKALCEGIQIDGKNEDQAALAAEVKKLRVKASQLSEELGKQQVIAGRANEIATKALQRNKVLETKMKEATAPFAESKEKKDEKLEDLRQTGEEPKTTRPTLVENQEKPKPVITEETGDAGVLAVASQLDGDPAFIGNPND